ncbi:MAG: hypothetical protein MJZ50_05220 [Treponema sp.]|nr:hypothetical protein [Treponema sp.]
MFSPFFRKQALSVKWLILPELKFINHTWLLAVQGARIKEGEILRVLDNTNLFDQKYSKDSVLAGGTAGISIGGGSGAAILGMSAHANTTAAISAASATTAAIAGAGVASAMAALPLVLPIAVGTFVVSGLIISHKKKGKIQKNVGIEDLARSVAEYVFLPVCGVANSVISHNPSYINTAKETVERQMRNWGYSMEFISEFVKVNLLQSTEDQIISRYNTLIYVLEKFPMNNTIPSCNLPVKYLKKFAKAEIKEFRHDLML